jgi:hypothetical protein
MGRDLRASIDSTVMGYIHTNHEASTNHPHSLSPTTCEHSDCNSRPDLDRLFDDDSASRKSETRNGRMFVTSMIGLKGTLKPGSNFTQTCVPNNDVLALHAKGVGPGNACVTYFPRPQYLTQEEQVLVISDHSGYKQQSGKTRCSYQLSQKDGLGNEKKIYLDTEDTETEQDKERKTLLVPGDTVQKEHLDLFEEDGWADVDIKISAHSGNPPSVWVDEVKLL